MAIDPRRTQAAWELSLPDSGAQIIVAELGDSKTAAEEALSRVEVHVTKLGNVIGPVLSRIQEQLGDVTDAGPSLALQELLTKAVVAGLFGHIVGPSSSEKAKREVAILSEDGARQLMGQAMSFTMPEPESPVEARLQAWSALSLEDVARVNDALEYLSKLLPELEQAVEAELTNSGGADTGAMLSALQSDLEDIVTEKGQ